VSYQVIFQLSNDSSFRGRVQSSANEQASTFINDARPDFVALSQEILRGLGRSIDTFTRWCAAAPGVADSADNGDGTITQSKVEDQTILTVVQGQWEQVANLYYNPDGSPLPV
jgi:hypothetical protein